MTAPLVIPVLVTGIHPAAGVGGSRRLDRGNTSRDDTGEGRTRGARP